MTTHATTRSLALVLLLALGCDGKSGDAPPHDATAKPDDAKTDDAEPAAAFVAPEGYVGHFAEALDAVLAGASVALPEAKAWGCSVKYGGNEPTAPAKPGDVAPPFSLPDLDGKQVGLADFAGKTVVLEWFNPDCPFVKYAHGEGGPLRTMAKQRGDAVVWLAINSGAPGKQGTGVARNREAMAEYGIEHAILLDESGDVGRAYGATNTPHMFVIDPSGKLAYAGALDNAPMGEPR
jgi:peroxiredoxin